MVTGFVQSLFPQPPAFIDVSGLPPGLRVGTSSWSSGDWRGTLYGPSTRPSDFIAEYARQLPTVEIDATFYGIPAEATVRSWREKTPPGFLFSAKAPQTVTHERGLVNCDEDWRLFLERMEILGDRLGPILLQFPYLPRGGDPGEWSTGRGFLTRLEGFLPRLPEGRRFAVEVRNEKWIDVPLLDLLARYRVALVLLEYHTMPPITRLMDRFDLVTSDFVYVRFLGHHREMDAIVEGRPHPWGSLAVDRRTETARWIPVVRELASRSLDVFVYFNNHFAGHAPGSIRLFLDLLREGGRGGQA